MSYPGIAIIGCDRLAGTYGVNEGIVDAKGTGVQHLFFDGFGTDLLHSATLLIKDGKTITFGNRSQRAGQHPVHLRPVASEAERGYVFTDRFICDGFERTDRAFGWGAANLGFVSRIRDTRGVTRDIEVYALAISQPDAAARLERHEDTVLIEGPAASIGVRLAGADRSLLMEEGPTGFVYRLTGAVLHGAESSESADIGPGMHAGILLGKRLTLPANGEVSVAWTLAVDRDRDGALTALDAHRGIDPLVEAEHYWESYLQRGRPLDRRWPALDRANQVAIKSATNNGFVPADLTGHYYADGRPCYYSRDALMVARAFLLAGHFDEARQIVTYLKARARKSTGEFFQRYDGLGAPSEGANNNVSRQLDSLGYMLRVIDDFAHATGERLLDDAEIAGLARVVLDAGRKNGLVGPEGGVNEGVFGPAYIVSSNMFIYGGLKSAMSMLGTSHPLQPELAVTSAAILEGIEKTFVPDMGYRYGYVDYHDDLVMAYDTPQYFGLLYGFKDTANMRATHRMLLELASFDGGIGYSTQAYHHGPWSFNTAACAEYAFLIGDEKTYRDKLDWLAAHANAYGLLPEAVSADDPAACHINPLVWACAETVSALHIEAHRR